MEYENTCAGWKKAVAALVRHTGEPIDSKVLTILEKEMGASTNMREVWQRMQVILKNVGEEKIAKQVRSFSGPLIAKNE